MFLSRGFLENLALWKKAFGNTQGSLVQRPEGSVWIPAGWQGLPRARVRFTEHLRDTDKYRPVCAAGLATVSLLLRGPQKGQPVIANLYKPLIKDKSTVPAFCPEIL